MLMGLLLKSKFCSLEYRQVGMQKKTPVQSLRRASLTQLEKTFLGVTSTLGVIILGIAASSFKLR